MAKLVWPCFELLIRNQPKSSLVVPASAGLDRRSVVRPSLTLRVFENLLPWGEGG